jgi:AraC-like DNA-binding protein
VGSSSPWSALKNQLYLGGERFVERMQGTLGPDAGLGEVPRIQRRPAAQPLDDYVSRYQDKKRGMARAYRSGWYTMKEIASVFGVHYSTVSRAVKQAEAKADN